MRQALSSLGISQVHTYRLKATNKLLGSAQARPVGDTIRIRSTHANLPSWIPVRSHLCATTTP